MPWTTKLSVKDNQIEHTIEIGEDTTIRMVRSGDGVIRVTVDAPKEKTIIRRQGETLMGPPQYG